MKTDISMRKALCLILPGWAIAAQDATRMTAAALRAALNGSPS